MTAGPFTDVERIQPIVEEAVEKHKFLMNSLGREGSDVYTGGISNVSSMTKISQHAIGSILKKRTKRIGFSTLDRLLTGLEMEYLSFLPPEEGGFKDVYDAPDPLPPRKDSRKISGRRKDNCACGAVKQARSKTCVACRIAAFPPQPRCERCDRLLAKNRNRATQFCWTCYCATRTLTPEQRKSNKNILVRQGESGKDNVGIIRDMPGIDHYARNLDGTTRRIKDSSLT